MNNSEKILDISVHKAQTARNIRVVRGRLPPISPPGLPMPGLEPMVSACGLPCPPCECGKGTSRFLLTSSGEALLPLTQVTYKASPEPCRAEALPPAGGQPG